ncbi:glutaminyl-peptide cyclotransferase [Glycomyces sp. L485]|uniref:glutaminyl-peptide cyclotransferase n=1 Tax=Glycomyces sp. L485 TaxID=2909235 RepID=UPI001F4AB258|nr:glutaminyl-peptide cyclotransferase [Glycomyces sp. L485]MCH7231157.1 glutaminyl-peptide cyclotransferase [Glycomyces sp. L485]
MRSVFDQKRAAALLGAAALAALAGCGAPADAEESEPAEAPGVQRLGVEVIDTFDHDPAAFTQGLELRDGVFYESTGLYGSSDIRLVDPGTGDVLDSEALPGDEFAEGLTLTDDAVWQITWQEGVAYQRDLETLGVVDTVEYEGEGWGICHDGGRLVMSDGSAELTFRDPDTFAEQGTVEVTLEGEPLQRINELECVDGQVWANVWQTDEIVRIDPSTGEVGAVVDASGMLTQDAAATADVLNGIAAAEEEDTFYITGKLWPTMFLVRFE